jgi:hypothetical protein
MRKVFTFSTIALLLFMLCGPGIVSVFAMDDANAPVDIYVDNQMSVDARVVIKQVDSYGPAWLCIHLALPSGEAGAIVGYSAVTDGMSQYVAVALDMKKLTSKNLLAVLHVDRGVVGIFEFPGADTIAKVGGQEIKVAFTVDY